MKRRDPEGEAYMAWIRSLCCIVCWMAGSGEWEAFVAEPWHVYGRALGQRSDTEAAHVGPRGLGQKCSPFQTIPLCGHEHHREGRYSHHKMQKHFWRHWGIDRDALIARLNQRYEKERAAA